VSWEGAFVHFAGYVLALAAAIASAGLLDGWSARTAGFVGGAVVGKLVADFMFAQPAPLGDARLSHALMRMTVLSPLWWGLPWGLLAAGYFHILENGRSTFFTSGLPVVYHVVIAVVFVFAAMTAVAFAQEYKEWGRSFPENEAAEGLQSPAAWTGFFAAVTALALVGYGIVHVPFWRSDKEIFGVETWTCAKDDGKWTLGWIPKTGVQITVRGYIDLFNISCVPRKDGKGCDYDDAGWDQIDIVVHGKDGFDTKVSFDRKSDGVIATLRHHADIYGALGREILLALYNGKAAELKIHAPGRRLLYTQRVDLTGYNSGLETCSAHWRQEQAHARR
jgi:hypothetical protein